MTTLLLLPTAAKAPRPPHATGPAAGSGSGMAGPYPCPAPPSNRSTIDCEQNAYNRLCMYVGYVHGSTPATVNRCHKPLATTRHTPGGVERAPPTYKNSPRLVANGLHIIYASGAQQNPCKFEQSVTGTRVQSIPPTQYDSASSPRFGAPAAPKADVHSSTPPRTEQQQQYHHVQNSSSSTSTQDSRCSYS